MVELEVKRRLYVSIVAVTSVLVFLSPILLTSYHVSLSDRFFDECISKSGYSFHYCLQATKSDKLVTGWALSIPFLPVAFLLWLNWLLRIELRLPLTSYPRRTVRGFLWFGIVVAVAVVAANVWASSTRDLKEVDSMTFYVTPMMSAAILSAPMLFDYLVGPVPSVAAVKAAMKVLGTLVLTPLIIFLIVVCRHAIA